MSRGALLTLDLLERPPAGLVVPNRTDDDRGSPPDTVGRTVTALIVGVPFIALAAAVTRFWGTSLHLHDVLLAIALYYFTGYGIAIGYHRLLTHKAFIARRPLRIALAIMGSMSFEGGPIGWVAAHRRHHIFADGADDPHSPHVHGTGVGQRLRGLWHAHLGWLFTARGSSQQRHAPDLLADRDIVIIDKLFPVWCVVSLGLPFGLGWLIGGTFSAAVGAFVWAGLVRICVLHHVTWSINSICHVFGRRPFSTNDRSSNVRLLSLLSMGESWHNGHHAFPRSARHGLLRGQLDTAALLIRAFEKLGWASDVHWPSAAALQYRRVGRADDRPPPPTYR
jgi:stearoyl-CoA desaturase (delta-9 desaturase)